MIYIILGILIGWMTPRPKFIGNEQGLDVNASGHVKMTRRDDGKTEVS